MNINTVMTEGEVNVLLGNRPNMNPFSVKTETVDGRTYKVTSYREQLSGLQRVARIIGAFVATIFTGFIGLLIPGVRNLWKEGFSGEKQMSIRILNERNQNNIPPQNELGPSVKKIEEFNRNNSVFATLDLEDREIKQKIQELEEILKRQGIDKSLYQETLFETIWLLAIAFSRDNNDCQNGNKLHELVMLVRKDFQNEYNLWLDKIGKVTKSALSLTRSFGVITSSKQPVQDLFYKAKDIETIVMNIKCIGGCKRFQIKKH